MDYSKFKKHLEKMYEDTCNIIERQKTVDELTKKTQFIEICVNKNVPCRLSYESSPYIDVSGVARVTQEIKLFLASDIEIKSGSKIVVTQGNKQTVYSKSGESKIYETHQEISLKLFEKWA